MWKGLSAADVNPIDYHALLPEIILAITVIATLAVDLITRRKSLAAITAMIGLFAAFVPVLTLAFCTSLEFCTSSGADRVLFGGSFVVDGYALVFKGVFLFAGFIVLLLSIGYLESDRYYEGEYYFLIVSAVLGAVVMASSRDFISMIVGSFSQAGERAIRSRTRLPSSSSSPGCLRSH